MAYTHVITAILAVLSFRAYFSEAFCSSEQPQPPYKLFGTKTLYDQSRGSLPQGDALAPPDCQPIHVTMVLRHGSRYPGTDAIKEFNLFQRLKTKINTTGTAESCPEDLQKIQSWKQWYKAAWLKNLAPTGEEEMKGIASRYKKIYPSIFPEAGNTTRRYVFISSSKLRSLQSGLAFLDGMYDEIQTDRPFIEVNNTLTRYYDDCERYEKEVLKNASTFKEVEKFENGLEMDLVIDALAKRLGIPRDELDYDITKSVYKTGCAEEEWATGNNSSWCLLFTKEDFQKFEYVKDILDYSKRGYVHPINSEVACELKNYVMESLKKAAEGFNREEDPVLGHFLFGHSGTVLTLATALKIYKEDGPYLADKYEQNSGRSFRTSLLAPGSANIAFVLYNCEGSNPGMKLQIHVNERVVTLPPGTNSTEDLWDLEDALSFYFDPKCDLKKICQLRGTEGVQQGQSQTLSTGAIVGIVVGTLTAISLLAILARRFFIP